MDTVVPWWQTSSLCVEHDNLTLDGVALHEIARQHGTPLYVYSRPTVRRQLATLQSLLDQVTASHRLYYAMKANRCPEILATVRGIPGAGIDTCSPREVATALASGFIPAEISFNAGMLSDRDLAFVAETTVHCTLDSFSALRRYGERAAPGAPVGLRFDAGVSASYGQHPKMVYGKSKFGFEAEECTAALAAAKSAGLRVDSVAMHIGWGLPQESADLIDWAFGRLAAVARQTPDLASINIGGGLGGRYLAADRPLSLETWSTMIAKHLAPLGVTIVCEPGTWVVAPAGVLIVEVNTVETRRQIQWIGVDAGYAINPLPAMYDIPLEVLPLCDPLAAPLLTAHIAGHINEGLDIWAKARLMPPVREGDLLAFFPAGAYGSSMASNHCMRGEFGEVAVG
ncbi:MAG: hypothetical protein KAX65_05785 [Caldilineaceae bacterium]|nr:hypothetical protein [Caldilineaceae bacterium]